MFTKLTDHTVGFIEEYQGHWWMLLYLQFLFGCIFNVVKLNRYEAITYFGVGLKPALQKYHYKGLNNTLRILRLCALCVEIF